MSEAEEGRVVVVGSLNVDLVAQVEHLPRSGETVTGTDVVRTPGGKGLNQAVAAARAGAAVVLVGAVGADEGGEWLLAVARDEGIDAGSVLATSGRATGTALITVDAGGANTIVVSPGANATASADSLVDLAVERRDVVVCQVEVPEQVVIDALRAGHAASATTVLNLAPFRVLDPEWRSLVDVLVVNETELEALLTELGTAVGAAPEPEDERRSWARRASSQAIESGVRGLVVTLGSAGAVLARQHAFDVVAARPVDVVDTVGAGDCLTGWLAAGLASGSDVGQALHDAVLAASLAVGRTGAADAMPTRDEVADARRRA